ncbi:hypothetical protein F4802DRAFT_537396 [Xylaria palmicola]|nr:hypothetical protein F4802DRAFT_537396 [Xylaria palmicola]
MVYHQIASKILGHCNSRQFGACREQSNAFGTNVICRTYYSGSMTPAKIARQLPRTSTKGAPGVRHAMLRILKPPTRPTYLKLTTLKSPLHGLRTMPGTEYSGSLVQKCSTPQAKEQLSPWTLRTEIKSGPYQLGQHRSSSLRLLTSMMRNHHQNTFSNGPGDATDDEFWTTFFIGELGKGWHFSNHLILRHRFSWVLEYIRTGSLPAQALSAQSVLREALNGSVLATATHPYNYSLDVVTTKYLNPDLCQEWTQELLTTQTNLEKIKADLQQSPESITIEALCSRYGILIPQPWEESTFHFGAHVYSARLTARSPMSNSRLETMRLDADPSFDLSSQVAGMSTSAKTDHESQAMCLDADLDSTLRIASNSTYQLRKDNPFGLDDAQHVIVRINNCKIIKSPTLSHFYF